MNPFIAMVIDATLGIKTGLSQMQESSNCLLDKRRDTVPCKFCGPGIPAKN